MVLLGSFLVTSSVIVILFAHAPRASWHHCVVRAACIAKIQYFCDSTLDLLSMLKIISSKHQLSAGTSSGASPASNSSSLVMERKAAEYPLGVCDVATF